MKDPKQFARSLRQKLDETGYAATLSPAEMDGMLQDFYDSGKHKNLLHQMAAHYNVPCDELMDLLVARQLIYLFFLTDGTVPGNEGELQAILRSQNARVSEIVERLSEQMSRLNDALRQTELLRDEAARVLAWYKEQYLLDQKAQENPK